MLNDSSRSANLEASCRWPRFGFSLILLAVAICLCAADGSVLAGPSDEREAENTPPLSFQKVKRVLAISELAAKNGMQDLSLRGVREALQNGTPWISTPGDIPPDDADDPQQFVVNHIRGELESLTTLWKQQKFRDTAVWETLCSVVLPKSHTDAIFVYQRLKSSDILSPGLVEQSVGSLLIRHSVATGRTAELRSLLETRLSNPRAQLDAWMLLLQLATEESNADEARQLLSQFPKPLAASTEPRHALPLAILSLRMWFSDRQREAVIPVMEQAVQNILSTPASEKANSCAASLVLLMTREHFLNGRREAGLRILELTEPLLTQRSAMLSESAVALLQAERQSDAALLLLQFGFRAEATGRLNAANRIEADAKSERSSASLKTASLARYLPGLAAAQRYEILRDSAILGQEAQLLSAFVDFRSPDVPPDAFRRLLPEEFRNTGFNGSADGLAGTLLSSATMLSDAAVESGQLETLRAELQKTVNDEDRKAWYLLLSHLQNGELAQAQPMLERLLARLEDDLKQNRSGRDPMLDLIAAVQAARHPQLRPLAIRILEAGRRFEMWSTKGRTLTHFCDALAAAHAAEAGSDATTLLQKAAPALWIPGGNFGGVAQQNGNPEAKWIAHEEILAHLTGRENDSLYFPWPLSGTFEFSVSSLDGEASNGDIGFAGLTCESLATTGTTTVSGLGNYNPVGRALPLAQSNTWVRKSARVTPQTLTFLVNGHPVFSENRAPGGNPWLHLSARAARTGLWRMPKFSGTPEIPREVALSADPLLRGWNCNLFNQSRSDAINPARSGTATGTPSSARRMNSDWSWDNGVITGRHVPDARRISGTLDENVQGLLQYERPMMSGESLAWEFERQAGRSEVHPALGRLAILIRPEGIRLHWMSIGTHEWTTLPSDNEMVVPEDRRGPAMPPLMDGWNTATLNLTGNVCTLAVNGETVYEHTLRDHDSRQFGLFHFRDQTAARARNLKLTGDWPERLTEEHLQGLTAAGSDDVSSEEHEALNRMIGTTAFATDPADIVRDVRTRPVEQRFEILRDWVLPSKLHADWRLHSDLADRQSDVAAGVDIVSAAVRLRPSESDAPAGAMLISPALELVRIANKTGRIDELTSIAEAAMAMTSASQREKLAFLILLAVEDGRHDEAVTLIGTMRSLKEANPGLEEDTVWPELLVSYTCLPVARLRTESAALLRQRVVRHMTPRTVSESADPASSASASSVSQTSAAQPPAAVSSATQATERFMHSVLATATLLDDIDQGAEVAQPDAWRSFRMMRADLRNDGVPPPLWVQHDDGSIRHVSGFEDDVLCWPKPIRGEFSFECELTPVGGEYLQIGYGGHFLNPATEENEMQIIPYGRDAVPIKSPLAAVDAATEIRSYRLVVAQQKADVWMDGELISSTELSANSDPWLCVRAAKIPGASIRSARITGSPEIPESVRIDTGRDLEGWCRPYFGGVGPFVPRNRSGSDWRSDESLVVGLHRTALAETKSESLLQYFRPLLEDGTMAYSFRYVPGSELVHPALGRTVFVLDKDRGVLVHSVTDGMYDRSGLDAGNLTSEPQNQLVQTLPLLVNDWNSMQVRLDGDTITLILNETGIFRRPLESTNDRAFGLFYFLDESSVRVRDVSWRGNWTATVD